MPGRIWLIGEHNPYGQDPEYALYPLPERATGGRLARVLGLTAEEYLAEFERRNLLDVEKWSAPLARVAARKVVEETAPGDSLVLLGARVSAAFGLNFRERLLEVMPAGRVFGGAWLRTILVIPHPSGLSREWNEPHTAPRVREAVQRLREIGGGGAGPIAAEVGICGQRSLFAGDAGEEG